MTGNPLEPYIFAGIFIWVIIAVIKEFGEGNFFSALVLAAVVVAGAYYLNIFLTSGIEPGY